MLLAKEQNWEREIEDNGATICCVEMRVLLDETAGLYLMMRKSERRMYEKYAESKC